MSEAFLGELRLFGFNWAPKDWALCTGQLVPIRQYTALFSLLGVNFGGDGRTTFGLPNLGGNVPVGAGTAVTGTSYPVGQMGGDAAVALTQATTPAHTHSLMGLNFRSEAEGFTPGPTMSYANASGCTPFLPSTTNPAPTMVPMALTALAPVGGAAAHDNRMPTVALNFCICLAGTFPPRGG